MSPHRFCKLLGSAVSPKRIFIMAEPAIGVGARRPPHDKSGNPEKLAGSVEFVLGPLIVW